MPRLGPACVRARTRFDFITPPRARAVRKSFPTATRLRVFTDGHQCVVASRPEFQINEHRVGGLGGDTGFRLRFFINRGEFKHFHDGSHDQADFQQP